MNEPDEVTNDMGNLVVGREAELGLLGRFLEASSERSCFVLSGEPGIGKTTLWEAGVDLARQAGYQVLVTRTSQPEAVLSFAALTDLCNGIPQEDLSGVPAPQLRALEVAVQRADPLSGPPDPLAISVGLFNALLAMQRRAPLLICIDDTQWVDAASSGPLVYAARRLPNERVRFLLTRRARHRSELEDALPRSRVEVAHVGPLSLGALGRVLTERLDLRLPRRVLRTVHEGSHGNPLYALEVGRSLGDGTITEVGAELPVPDLAKDFFGKRIEEANESVRRVLLALALVGGLSLAELSSIVHPLAIEDALASELVVADQSRLRLAHPMLGATTRRRASVSERQAMHVELAAALTDPTLRARHRAMATPAADAGIAEAIAAAAELATSRGRFSEGLELAEHALRLTPVDDPARGERVLVLAGLRVRGAQVTAAEQLIEAHLDELPQGRPRAMAHLVLFYAGREESDPGHLDKALALAGDDPEVHCLVYSGRAVRTAIGSLEGLDEAQHWAEKAAATVVETSEEAREKAAAALAWTRTMRGLPIDDITIPASNESTGVDGYHAPGRAIGVRFAFRGELKKARSVFDAMAAEAEERGELMAAGALYVQRCEVELRAGHLHDIPAILENLDDSLRGLNPDIGSFIARLRALRAAIMGDRAAAIRWTDSMLEGAPGTTLRAPGWNRLEAERALGLAALYERDLDGATGHLQEVWRYTRRERIDDPGAFPVAGDLVEALVELGRLDEARDVVGELQRLSVEQEHPWGLATSQRGEALLELAAADHYVEAAADQLAQAAATYGELGLEFDQARTLLTLGTVQRRFKKRAGARSSLEQAAAFFERNGSTGWAARARDELSRVSGRRASGEDELTETETRVATLAASGLSNKEIARQLFITVKTVEGHLSRAYGKLGVGSRGELARYLRESAHT